MKTYNQFLLETKEIIVYSGNNSKSKTLDPKWMFHDTSNNQEGVGIYFSNNIDTAKSYGNFILSTTINPSKLLDSRDITNETISTRSLSLFIKSINKDDPDFWYIFTDYGFEIQDESDVNDEIIESFVDMMAGDEIRNFQTEILQAMGKSNKNSIFVKHWIKYIKSYGTYHKQNNNETFFALMKLNTPIVVLE